MTLWLWNWQGQWNSLIHSDTSKPLPTHKKHYVIKSYYSKHLIKVGRKNNAKQQTQKQDAGKTICCKNLMHKIQSGVIYNGMILEISFLKGKPWNSKKYPIKSCQPSEMLLSLAVASIFADNVYNELKSMTFIGKHYDMIWSCLL